MSDKLLARYIIMTGSLSPDQIIINKLTDIIIANLRNENFGVKELARESNMSLYSLSRKIHSIKRIKINQFIREVRLEKALELLRSEDITASEVAYKTGFSTPAYFNRCFHEYYGYPPGKVKNEDSSNKYIEILCNDIDRKRLVKHGLKRYLFSFPGIVLSAILAVIVGLLVLNKIQKAKSTLSDKRISIAVMPFQNRTNDSIWNVWQDWIQHSFISYFSNTLELKVRQEESINTLLKVQNPVEYSRISPSVAGKISKKLKADLFIYGDIQSEGSVLRLDAQLIDTETGEVLKAFEKTGPYREGRIFQIIDSLRYQITDFLVISKMINDQPFLKKAISSYNISPDAIRFYLQGNKAWGNADYLTARNWYKKAFAYDSNFYPPALMIMFSYSSGVTSGGENALEQELLWATKLQKKSDQMPVMEQLWINFDYAGHFEPPGGKIKYLKRAKDIDDQRHDVHLLLGASYNDINQYDKAIPEFEKYLELISRWDIPLYPDVCSNIIKAYHKTGRDKEAWRLIKKVEKNSSDDPLFYFTRSDQAILLLSEGDTIKAKKFIDRYFTLRKENLDSEADITEGIASIYKAAGTIDKAEELYRKALLLEPENTNRMKTLADFFIEHNRNLAEVPSLMDKAMASTKNKVEYYNFLDIKGYALFKQGKYNEALEILQKAWNEAPFKLYYIKSHLEEVNKSVASQNQN